MESVDHQCEWQVLPSGGSSGVGKTVVAHALAREFAASVLLVDDIRLALKQVTTPEQHPGLHVFQTDRSAAQRTAEQICDGLIQVGQALTPAVKIIIAHHVVVHGTGRVVIEGDGILPHVAAHHRFGDLKHFAGFEPDRKIRAVFLVENNEQALLQNSLARNRGFQDPSPEEQRTLFAEVGCPASGCGTKRSSTAYRC